MLIPPELYPTDILEKMFQLYLILDLTRDALYARDLEERVQQAATAASGYVSTYHCHKSQSDPLFKNTIITGYEWTTTETR
jgi:hypothetical protein